MYICKGYSARQLISGKERVYQQLVQDVDELKLHLIDSWSRTVGQVSSTDIQQVINDQATDQWQVRLTARIPETGRYFEHSNVLV